MKNSNFIKNSIIALLPISFALGVVFATPNEKVEETSAYSFSTLPTTITLRDNSETEIRNYYSALNSKSISQRKGNDLLINLKTILSDGQNYFTYDKDSNGRQIWQMYEITDRDWVKSPASAINGTGYGTYNESTKEIVNYVYGTATNTATNPYLHSLYVNRDADNPKIAWGYHGSTYREKDERCIEREHIWPKSYGFDKSGAGGARGDPMHLWAADGYANGLHNNNPYGFVDKSKKYSDSGNNFGFTAGNILGKSLNFGNVYTGSVFEPQDSDKGDIARACFYMAARYNNLSGKDSSIDSDNPYLILSDNPSNETGASTSTKSFSLGFVSDLLEWNKLDPVDEYERHRNNLLFNNYTNNRNPFIDFPQWADMIWGKSEASADPQNDAINNGQSETTCTKIEMTTKPSKLSYNVGDTIDTKGMVITAYFSDGTKSVVTDYEIIPSGKLKTSNKELTVTYMGKSVSCFITVTGEDTEVPDPIVLSSTSLDLGDYKNGSNSVFGVSWIMLKKGSSSTIQGSFANSSEIHNYISNGYGIDEIKINVGYAASSNNYAYVKFGSSDVEYEESIIIGKGTDYPLDRINSFTIKNPGNYDYFRIMWANGAAYFSSIEVSYKKIEKTVINVESVSLNETILELEIGDKLTLVPTVLPVNATNKNVSFESNKSAVVKVNSEGAITALSAGTATITVTTDDGSKKATCSVTVTEPVYLTGISISDFSSQRTTFFIKEEFDYDGLLVIANYSNGTKVDVSDDVEVSDVSTETVGNKKVTVSYQGFDAYYYISVTGTNLVLLDFPNMSLVSGKEVSKLTESVSKMNVIFDKGTNTITPKYYSTGEAIRVYGSNTITICGLKKITSIKFIFDSGEGSNPITADSGSYTDHPKDYGIWSGNADCVKFTVGSSSGHRRIQKIYVTYDSETKSNLYKGLTISGEYKTTFNVGESFSSEGLVATASYYDGTTKVVTPTFTGFSSASVGEKEITVSYTENSRTFSQTYKVNIVLAEVKLVSISLSGSQKKEFFKGDTFDYTGLVVTATYSDSSSSAVNGYVVSEPDLSVVSNDTKVVVSYTADEVTKSASYSIKVIAKLLSISIEEKCKDSYFIGEKFDSKGLVVKAHYNDNSSKVVTPSFTEPTLNTVGKKNVELSYKEYDIEVTTNLEITVQDIIPISMALTGSYKTEFFIGDDFTVEGLGVKLTMNNGDTKDVLPTSFTGYDMSKAGTYDVIVHYDEVNVKLETSYQITVGEEPAVLDRIELSGEYKTSYFVGDTFSKEGLVVTAIYSNGTSKDVVSSSVVSGYDMKKTGEQLVTVTFEEGGVTKTAQYLITVNALSPVSLSLSGNYKTEFEVGDDFDTSGLVATVTYDNGSTAVVTPDEITGYDMDEPGEYEVVVSYEENGKTVKNAYEITVKMPKSVLKYIELSGSFKTQYFVGENFSSEGLVVIANYSDGSYEEVTPTSISGYKKSVTGVQTITVTYEEDNVTVEKTYQVTVKSVDLEIISVSGNYKTEYEYGESFSAEGLIVTASYSNGTTKAVIPTSIGGYNATKPGYQVITISYKENGVEKSTSYQIKVKSKEEPQKEEPNLPVIIGAAGGGTVGVGAIIGIICVVVKKKH